MTKSLPHIDYIIIVPISYLGPKMIPGHKKDLFFLSSNLQKTKYKVKMLYFDGTILYTGLNEKFNYSINDILRNNVYKKSKIIIGPLHEFRQILFRKIKRELNFYVFDSILKTSIFAFLKNPLLMHRVIYAYIIEKALKRHRVLVASLGEYVWFSSSGHALDKIHLLTPSSGALSQNTKKSTASRSFKILIYNPPADSAPLYNEILKEINKLDFEKEVIVTGREPFLAHSNKKNIKHLSFVDDITNLICEAAVVVMTDVSGSGFCNRAAQVRGLGVPLICTLPSVRGTGLQYDAGVELYSRASQCADLIVKIFGGSNDGMSCNIDLERRSLRDIEDYDREISK